MPLRKSSPKSPLAQNILSDLQLREMSAVGGLLLMGVGLKLLDIRDVKVADFLPAFEGFRFGWLNAPAMIRAARP